MKKMHVSWRMENIHINVSIAETILSDVITDNDI